MTLTQIIIGILALIVGFLFKDKLKLESLLGNKKVLDEVNKNNETLSSNNTTLTEEEKLRSVLESTKKAEVDVKELLDFLNKDKK